MALTGLLGGYNEQRDATTNYLAQLEQMRRAAMAQQLQEQQQQAQRAQFAQELGLRQQQAIQGNALQQAQLAQSAQAHQDALRQQAAQLGLQTREQQFKETTQNSATQRQEQARNALSQLLNGPEGGDIATADLARAILPYDIGQGASLLKASKEEQRQQALLDKTGGTGVQPPQGYRWTAQGNLEAIPGGSADPAIIAQLEGIKSAYKSKEAKPLTEAQANAAGYGMRAAEAATQLDKLAAQGTTTGGLIKQGVEAVPLIGGALGMAVNALPGYLGGPSTEQQQVEQAQRNFINAVLRRESGAAISPAEFENARKQYFPQPGDSPETLAQKQQNMATTIDALRLGAGSGAEHIPAYSPGQKSQKELPKLGSVQDGYLYNGGNPADQNSWRKL